MFKQSTLNLESEKIKKEFPGLRLNESEEDEFDPNELKLLPVLVTDRNSRKHNELELFELRK